MQPGDVQTTYADISLMKEIIDFEPETSLEIGLKKLVNWYKDFYKI